ncbi:NADH-quinone oxidoreductase subunit NuoE [Nocardioides sp. GY 10113]|uniref:NADH-quinone oxidoreductase subunit NuoE n=1 Tax=Nocardioides sp. GY 10113 TaxID=2569761 RepID=UPI0010A79C90|nr:NADH-quinone oxidoreductase subunit NuoE [Nocardioides sp. GY 10113]TIC89274.1 NADH-quinone oxidoreductase subunit NuoE [Nocardioides sp. GY 10113]
MSSTFSDGPSKGASASAAPKAITETTLAELREIAGRYPEPRSGLLPMLHLVQSAQGKVTPEGVEACAEVLGISAAEVHGVATFYTMYKRHEVGDFHVGVCTNTLCAVMGGDAIFERLKEHLGIGNDEVAPRRQGDQRTVSLEHLECNAACDYAPVMMVNWEFLDNQTPESAVQTVEALRAGHPVRSTRGPRLCTWREAERVLAGFPDDRVDEGPGAGPASLVGLRMARENGWTAPEPPAPATLGGVSEDRTPQDKEGAVAHADTARAESETVEESTGAASATERKEADDD